MLFGLSMICMVAIAQKTVTGTVQDESGETLIGVNVTLKGVNNSLAVTDINGNYSLTNVKESDILVFTFIGFKTQEIAAAQKTTINAVMEEDVEALDEVVIVGYGSQKKSDLTGSVGTVNMEKMLAKGTPSLLETMQGSVPGVSITQSSGRTNGGFDVEIRGKSSTNSDTKPIYVVDGVICSDINFLNTQDIERIDILKDASSTAIYGSRASAGVVMVTTRSAAGVSLKAQTKPSISYDGYYGVSNVARMPNFMDGEEFYQYRFLKFLTYAEGGSATALSGRPAYAIGSYQQMALWNNETGTSRLKELMANGGTWDWPSLVTRSGLQQNHYLSVGGSTDVSNYYMGVGYNEEKGIYEGDSQSRLNFKGSMDAQLSKYISAGFNVNMAYVKNTYANDNGIKGAFLMNPFMQPYDVNNELNEKPGNYTAMGSSNGNQFSDQVNPLLYIDNQTKERETYRLLGNAYLQIKPMKGLSLKTTFSPNYTYYRQGEFNDILVDNENNSAILTTSRGMSYTWDNIISYNKDIAEHHIDLLGLYSYTYGNTEYATSTFVNVMDGTLWWNTSTAAGTTDTDGNSNNDAFDRTASKNSYTESSLMSYALRANYNYAGKYMLTGTVRWDGSSKFAEENRWGYFPSMAAAWRISEEGWMDQEWLSNLKLRLSYGTTGNNTGIGNYETQQTVSGPVYYPFGTNYMSAYYPSAIVNRDITWETSKEINLGIDFGFFKNRISGSVDVYDKNSENLLYDVKLPLEAGTDASGNTVVMTTNIGKVRNRGIEAALTTVNVENRDWRWETSFMFAKNINEVVEINGTGEDLPNDGLFIGQPINNVYGYEWTGIVNDRDMIVPDNEIARLKGLTPGATIKSYDYYYACYGWTEGQVIIDDKNGDGSFNDSDKKVYSSDPSWIGSFSTSISYKNWDLSASLYAKMHYTVSSAFYGQYLNWSDRGRLRLNADYYIPAGALIDCGGVNADGSYINPVYQETTKYGAYPFPNNGGKNSGVGSDLWIGNTNKYVDVSYCKIKNITLGYTIPRQVLKKIGVDKLRLYCIVTNPFVFTNYAGFDPEWADTELKNDGPSTTTWEFGANLRF